jgi:hypothetical protein
MFVLRNRPSLIGFIVLIIWGCAPSRRHAVDDSDAEHDKQIESGVIDVGVMPDDAATDVGADTSITNACRVVDLEENRADAAAMDAMASTAPLVTGTIIDNGDCLSGVEVCLTIWNAARTETYSALTDRYGVFEVPTQAKGRVNPRPADFELTPRKAGYRFEPSSSQLTDSILDSGMSGLSFTAIEVGLPNYATGQWRVIEESCDYSPSNTCDIPDTAKSWSTFTDFLKFHSGDVLTFENGCLFGGINCVEGLHYSDEGAFCGNSIHGSISGISEGDYDPETQNLKITRTLQGRIEFQNLSIKQQMTLKQELHDEDAGK